MPVSIHVVNAFTDDNRGGNPAGIVLNADALTTEQKQTIARQVGLSETAFVSASTQAPFKLEFFTPARQIAHCGHATIATFALLYQLDKVSAGWTAKETIDGIRKIALEGDMAFMEQTEPQYTPLPPADVTHALTTLGLTTMDLLAGKVPVVVSTGNRFLIVPLHDSRQLLTLSPDQSAIAAFSQRYDLIGYYVFAASPKKSESDVIARMFAPYYGIPEEAATGMAAGPLACYLYDELEQRQDRFSIRQGLHLPIPSPSRIIVDLKLSPAGRITGLLAGGRARLVETQALPDF